MEVLGGRSLGCEATLWNIGISRGGWGNRVSKARGGGANATLIMSVWLGLANFESSAVQHRETCKHELHTYTEERAVLGLPQ